MEFPKKTISAQLHDNYWVAFQRRTDLVETIKEDERFYAGEQWDGPNPNNEPRITINKIQDAIRKISSKINGTPLYLTFTASDGKTDCTALRRYDEFVTAKMGHKAFSFQSVINGENLGTEITYMAYDPDVPFASGGFYCGGLSEKHISPLEFAVANPHENDIQKQEWVMTWTDAYVGQLIKILESEKAYSKDTIKELKERLVSEGRRQLSDSTNTDKDIINNTLVRVYLRHFRIDKEVVYTLETESVPLFAYPKPMSKKLSGTYAKEIQKAFDKQEKVFDEDYDDYRLVHDYEMDFEDTIINATAKKASAKDYASYQEKFSLYPYAIYTPKVINNFIFGMSITKAMITIQQAINYAASLQVKHLQNMAFSKVVAKEDALGGDVWSNDPADNIQIDHSRGDSFGFKTLEVPTMPNDAYKIPDWLTESMKDTYGFGEIISGQLSNQDMSGYLYSLALKQANSTLEQEQQLFWQYQIDLARIRLMFYKHYVSKRVYTYEMTESEYQDEEKARLAILAGYQNGLQLKDDNGQDIPYSAIQQRFGSKTAKTQVKTFDSEQMWGVDFDIKIVAQQGMLESELSTTQWYQQMFGNGQVQQYAQNPEMLTFIAKTAPNGVIPEEYRATMAHYGEEMERKEVVRLRQENAQLMAQLEQLSGQLGQQQQLMKAQEQEFGKRLNAASQLAMNAQKQAQQMQQVNPTQINEGEVKSNNAKGIPTNLSAMQSEQPMI